MVSNTSNPNLITRILRKVFFPAASRARVGQQNIEAAYNDLSTEITAFNSDVAKFIGSKDPIAKLARQMQGRPKTKSKSTTTAKRRQVAS